MLSILELPTVRQRVARISVETYHAMSAQGLVNERTELLLLPAASVVLPVTASAPLCVMAPPAVTLRVPLTVLAPSTIAFVSASVTLLALLMVTVLKSLVLLPSVMLLLLPAARVVLPVTASAPLCVIVGPAKSTLHTDLAQVVSAVDVCHDSSVVNFLVV